MPLSEEQIDHYFRDGYLIVRGLISPERLAPVRERAAELVNDNDRFQPHIYQFDHPDTNDPIIHAPFLDERVIKAVEQIFHGPALAYYGFLALLPARYGKGLPWHQDNQYTQFHGLALNTFIAVDRVEPDMGHLWIAPGSHRHGTLPSIEADEETGTHHRTIDFEPTGGFCLPAFNAGDAVLFDRNTLHRSLENMTDRPRICYAAQFVAEHARLTENGKRSPNAFPPRQLRESLLGERPTKSTG